LTGRTEGGDVYYSRNGGRIFSKILSGKNYCKLLDEGGIIVCVPGDNPTNFLYYTLNSGTTWNKVQFTDSNVQVLWIYSDPDSFGLSAVIEASQGNSIIFFTVDFEQLNLPACVDSDYENWYPVDSNNGGYCILGHQSTYVRPTADAACFSSLNQFLVKQQNCSCSDQDYSCDLGYFYNNTGKVCTPEPNTLPDNIECQNGFYYEPQHFRFIPGDTCNMSLPGSVDLINPVMTSCPVQDLVDAKERADSLALSLGVGVTILAILIAAAVIFVIWSKRRGYLQYRLIPTNENDIGNENQHGNDEQGGESIGIEQIQPATGGDENTENNESNK